MKPQRIILDVDPGIDDAMTILLAQASPEVQLEAITVVNGNVTVDLGSNNALKVLELIHAEHIPVYRGMDRPLVQPLLNAFDTHGTSGLGYANLPEPVTRAQPQHAVDYIINKVLESPGEITIVAVGPLTNLAMAIRREPAVIKAIKALYIMGGAVKVGGNVTPQAEFNIYCDPHAAHVVLNADTPTFMAPLDVTYQTLLRAEQVEQLQKTPSRVTQFVADAGRYVMEFLMESQDVRGVALNDPLALAMVFAPGLVKTYPYYVGVDVSCGVSMGKTFADFYNVEHQSRRVHVGLEVDADGFVDLFVERIHNLAAKLSTD